MADFLPTSPQSNPADLTSLIRAALGGGFSATTPTALPPDQAPGTPSTDTSAITRAIQGIPSGAPAAATPTAAPTGSDDALRQMILSGSDFSKTLAGEQVGRMRTAEDATTQALAQQKQLMANPPQVAPKNAALRILLGLTGPGRMAEAAYYQPGVERFEAQRKELADRIATLGTQAKEEGNIVPSALGGISRGYSAYGSAERGLAAMLNAQTRQLQEQHQDQNRKTALQIQSDLGKGKLTQEAARTKMMGEIAEQRNETMQAIARQATQEHWSATQLTAATQQADDLYNQQSQHWLQTFTGLGPSVPTTAPPTPAQSNRAGQVQGAQKNAKKPVGNTVNF